jgi:XTP/dITP diphosphohydrolase
MKILLGTTNYKKIQDFLSYDYFRKFSLITLKNIHVEEASETEATLVGNALQKAKHYHQKTGFPTLSDDTGLFLHALDGFPGVLSGRIARDRDPQNFTPVKALLAEKLAPYSDKSATFSTALAYVNGRKEYVVQGDVLGRFCFPSQAQNPDNTGYRDVFWPDGANAPLSDLSLEDWQKFSARGRAIQLLIALAEREEIFG